MRMYRVTRQLAAAVMGGLLPIVVLCRPARCLLSIFLLLVAVPGLTGCGGFFGAELNNRGGYLDQKLDEKWILADTKQMRVLRAYVMIGSLARMSRENYYKSERQLIAQHVNSAVRVAFDAYTCAYARPGDCVYFDERMAELEVSVIRLAIAVFSKHENESLFQLVASQADETAPLLKVLFSAAKVVDAASTATDAVASTGKLIKSLLNLGEAAYFTGRRAGALYRDSIELTMIATMGSLDVQCQGAARLAEGFATDQRDGAFRTFQQFYGYTASNPAACTAFKNALAAWRQGAGELSDWHDFLAGEGAKFHQQIVPVEGAFVQASDLVWRACEQIAETDAQLAVCLGHRGPEASERECNIDQKGVVAVNVKTLKNPNWTELGQQILENDSCRLILFGKTWASRNGRLRGASDTRIFWLSVRGESHISNRSAKELYQ
ncbi:MAG: hypothetical protein ABL907_11385 [Hyphomicrobium sp.]